MSEKRKPGANNLAELLSSWDSEFVEKAYWTLLGRAPDPDGGTHYLNQIRSGVSKLTILLRLSESQEGRAQDHQVDGLDDALRKHRQAIQPFTGGIVRMITGRAGDTGQERTRRAIVNHLAAINPEAGTMTDVDARDRHANFPSASVGARTEFGMVDHLLMRMVRVEASLKRIEDRLKRIPPPKGSEKVARRS